MTFYRVLRLCILSFDLGMAVVNLIYVTVFRRIARETEKHLRRK